MQQNDDLNNMLNIMAEIERGNVDKVASDLMKTRGGDVLGMQQALDVLKNIEREANKPEPQVSPEVSDDVDYCEYIITEPSKGIFTLKYGSLTLIQTCRVENGLYRLISLLKSGCGLESPESLEVIKLIAMVNYYTRLLEEIKTEYKACKSGGINEGLDDIKEIKTRYTTIKTNLTESISKLSK